MLKGKKIIILLVSSIILLSACFNSGSSPSDTLKSFADAIKDNDLKKAFNYLSDESIDGLSEMFDFIIEMAEEDAETKKELEYELGVSFEELKSMNERDCLALMMEKTGENPFAAEDMDFEIVSEEINGDEATVTIKISSGDEIPIIMIKESGTWKLEYN